MIRSFIAIDLPDGVKDALQEIGERLRRQMPGGSVRWSRVSGIHLTLKFLGNVDEGRLPEITAALTQIGQRHAPFSITVAGVGCFPNTNKPRVVWVGLEEERGDLKALQRDVDKILAPLGFDPEKRAYHPHLTLGRTRRGIHSGDQRRVGEIVASADVGALGRLCVESFRLIQSDLRPNGAVYTPLEIVALTGESA